MTKSNVLFFKENKYIVLCPKQSRTNSKHTGAQIVFLAMDEKIYPVATIYYLNRLDFYPTNISLFCLLSAAFLYFSIVIALKKRLLFINVV